MKSLGGWARRRRSARRGGFVLGAGLVALALWRPVAMAVPIVVRFSDEPGEGFFDPELGPARQAAMQFAAERWAERLPGTITVGVDAQMETLGGSAAGALLGVGGPTEARRDFLGAPLLRTWFGASLAHQLLAPPMDANGPDRAEMGVRFNSDVGERGIVRGWRWYYGTDGNPGTEEIDFVTVALHELAHGLGYYSDVSIAGHCSGGTNADRPCQEDWHCVGGTCQGGNLGALREGSGSAYDAHLIHVGVGRLVELTDAQRAAALLSDAVVFDGPAVRAALNGPAKVYASPPPADDPGDLRGSLLSHLDPSFSPDQLMETRAGVPAIHEPDLAVAVLTDLGWASCVAAHPSMAYCSVRALADDLAAPLDPTCSGRCQKRLRKARDTLAYRLGTVRKAVDAAVDAAVDSAATDPAGGAERCRVFVDGASRIAKRFQRLLGKLVRRGRIAPAERAARLAHGASQLRDHLAQLAQVFCANRG